MLMESLTVMPWNPPAPRSFSVRPKQGKMSASRPCTRWLRLSFVLTWIVRSQFCRAGKV